MPGAVYARFRSAILGEQQVVCLYDGRVRELCPHIIGTNRRGEEVVLAWQFGGESSNAAARPSAGTVRYGPAWLSLVTLTFKRDGDGTLMTLMHEKFFDEDARDRHQTGWTSAMEKLDKYLTA